MASWTMSVEALGLPTDISSKLKEHGIDDAETLLLFSVDELKQLGIKIGHAKKLLNHFNPSVIASPVASAGAKADTDHPQPVVESVVLPPVAGADILAGLDPGVPPVVATHDFFLSHYQGTGGDQAATLHLQLKARGVSSWYDQAAESVTLHSMLDGIRRARIYLLFLSDSVMTREYVQFEARCALKLGLPILLMHETDPNHGAVNFAKETAHAPDDLKPMLSHHESIPWRRRKFEQDAVLDKLLQVAAQVAPSMTGLCKLSLPGRQAPTRIVDGGRFRIRNYQQDELLYAGSKMLDTDRRYALTWTGEPNKDPAMVWELTSDGSGRYRILNPSTGEFLCTGWKMLDKLRRYAFTWAGQPNDDLGMMWELIDVGDGRHRIRNVRSQELLFVGSKKLDRVRRYALTWTGAANQDPAMLWEIIAA